MAEEAKVKCRVCGAENPSGVEFCESCGVKLEAAPVREEAEVDKLLEELIESPGELEAPEAEGPQETIDPEKELVDELLDSLLVEEQAAPTEEFECPLCGTPLPVHAEVCTHCGARFARVEAEEKHAAAPAVEEALAPAEEKAEAPVAVTVTEEDVAKLKVSHGRMIDLTVAGTIVGMVVIFLLGEMYKISSWSANIIVPIIFFVILTVGMAVGVMLLRISTSAIAQGDKLVKEGSYQDAIYYYDRAIRMGLRPASAWASKGVAMKRMGNYDDALRCQNVAIKLDPENEIAWCNKGDIYFKSGNLEKAIKCYDKAIELKPKYAIAWNNKGAALAVSKKFKEAKECHDKAVRIKPKYVVAWLNRGEVLAKLGMRDEAKKCLDRAKALGA